MRAGALRRIAQIQQPTKTRGDSGEQVKTYATVARRFVRVLTKVGNEQQRAGMQVTERQQYTVELRYDSGLSDLAADWRLVMGYLTLRIASVENVGMANRWLRLVCEVDD